MAHNSSKRSFFTALAAILVPVVIVAAVLSSQTDQFRGDFGRVTPPQLNLCAVLEINHSDIQDSINYIYKGESLDEQYLYLDGILENLHVNHGVDTTEFSTIMQDLTDSGDAAFRIANEFNRLATDENCDIDSFYEYNPIKLNVPAQIDQADFDNAKLEDKEEIELLGVGGKEFELVTEHDLLAVFIEFSIAEDKYVFDAIGELTAGNSKTFFWDGETCGNYESESTGLSKVSNRECPLGEYDVQATVIFQIEDRTLAVNVNQTVEVINSGDDEDAPELTLNITNPDNGEEIEYIEPFRNDYGDEIRPVVNIQAETNLPAFCQYSTSDFVYGTAGNSGTNFYYQVDQEDPVSLTYGERIPQTNHSIARGSGDGFPIEPGESYTIYVKCKNADPESNEIASSSVSFTTTGGEVEVPSVTISSPRNDQQFASGTTTIALNAVTDIPASCSLSESADPFFNGDDVLNSDTASVKHDAIIDGLENGQTYTYYVNCTTVENPTVDQIGQASVTFSVAASEDEVQAEVCTYITDNRDETVTLLTNISNDLKAGDVSNLEDHNTALSDTVEAIKLIDETVTGEPEEITITNYQTALNEWIDFLNGIPIDCDTYKSIPNFDFTNPNAPVVEIDEPDNGEEYAAGTTEITVEAETDITSSCEAILYEVTPATDDEDEILTEVSTTELTPNSARDEHEAAIDGLEDGTDYRVEVNCTNTEDPTAIGSATADFSVLDITDPQPTGALECSIDGDEDDFDPALENIRLSYTVESDDDIEDVDYIITIENEDGAIITELSDKQSEELDVSNFVDWNGRDNDQIVVDGEYIAVIRAIDSSNSANECEATYNFDLDNSLIDGNVLEINVLNNFFEPGITDADLELINRIEGVRVVVNAYELGNAAPIRTVFYQCDSSQNCPQTRGALTRGVRDLIWDGSDAGNRYVVPGIYFFKASLKDDDGNVFVAISDTIEAEGTIGSIPPGGGVPPTAACTFPDVPPSNPFHQALQWNCANGIFTQSDVNKLQARVDAFAIANRLAKCPATTYNPNSDGNLGFSDLTQYVGDPNTFWFFREIKNASRDCVSKGQTISGYPDGTVRINDIVLASEMWKIVVEAAKNGNRANYTLNADTTKNPWYIDYQNLLQSNGVPLKEPAAQMTRGDTMKLIHDMYLRGLIR